MRTELRDFEGLVFETARMYERLLGWEREDLQQVLRLKVWVAIEAHDPRRSAQPLDKFVFGCVRNQIRDLVKAKTRRDKCHECGGEGCDVCDGRGRIIERESYIDDHLPEDSSNGFERDHLSHIDIHEDDDQVILPDTITRNEREIISLLYVGYRQREIAALLERKPREVERQVRNIKRKLTDWHPGTDTGDAEVIELESQIRHTLVRAAA